MTEQNNFGIELKVLIYPTEDSQLLKYKNLVADGVLVCQKKIIADQRKTS